MASALEALAVDPECLPAVVGVDVLYTGNTSDAEDERLANAAKVLDNVVTGTMAEYGSSITWENGRATDINTSTVVTYLQPYDALKSSTVQGHINAMNDFDGTAVCKPGREGWSTGLVHGKSGRRALSGNAGENP